MSQAEDGLRVSIMDWDLYSWESQFKQYDRTGPPGISYFRGPLDRAASPTGEEVWVDCLLYRNRKGSLIGILNHYPVQTFLEDVGNINIWIHPRRQGRGIGTALVEEAERRYGPLNWKQQRFTLAGLSFIRKYQATHEKVV